MFSRRAEISIHSGFYNIVVQKICGCPRRALSETELPGSDRPSKKSKGAVFTDEIRRIAKRRRIDLKLNPYDSETRAATSR
jgi:hypothetical protein